MQYRMALNIKEGRNREEKIWENPADPKAPMDGREKEQLLRQYKEAKRRKDNLTTREGDKNEQTK